MQRRISNRVRLRSGDVTRQLPRVIRLLHEEEEEHESEAKEDGRPVKDPSPTLVLCNETADDWGEVIATQQEERVDAHVCTSFVGEVLYQRIFSNDCTGLRKLLALTMSVTEISGRASIGAIKKPWMIALAIHSPSLVTYALSTVSAPISLALSSESKGCTSRCLCPVHN